MIVNDSKCGARGTHWVAIYFDINGHSEYFDSYGQDPVVDISSFISSNFNHMNLMFVDNIAYTI